MLEKSNAEVERKIIHKLIEGDAELGKQHDLFLAEMELKQDLINARKSKALTQKELSELSGLTQQAVSRLEKGKGGTIETVIKYLNSIGYKLEVKEY